MGEAEPTPVQVYNCPFRLPPELELTTGNVSENFKKWKRQVEVYLAASGGTEKAKEVQVAIILSCGGPHVVEIYDQFQWDDGNDKNDPDKLFQKLQSYCNPRSNEVLESHRFWKLPYQDPFDSFLTDLKTRAASCNFQEPDRMMRDKIVFTVTGKLQELLLREDKLTLERTIQVCRAYEQSNRQVKELREATLQVNKLQRSEKYMHSKPKTEKKKEIPKTKHTQYKKKDCEFCGYKHEPGRQKCPAWGKCCEQCGGRNHFKAKCKKIHSVSQEEEFNEDQWLKAVSSGGKEVTAIMRINECDIRFQLDSAADVNTISQRYVRKEQCKPTKIRLNMWNKTNMKPLGEADLTVVNPRTNEKHQLRFIVVPNHYTCLLGLEAVQKLKLITINNEKFISSVSSSDLGDLGTAHLHVDPNVKPKALPCRKIPIALQSLVHEELQKLEDRGVLIPITEPTPWVSQMAIARKANGKLRLCIDPQALNTALMREHYRLPVLDDILPQLSKARTFTKLDVKEAFWHVKLDEESSRLTTMITPFGRYRWARLPFGLKVSSEIFQRKLDEVFGNMTGVFSVVDDIIIAGCGENDVEAEQDHALKLRKVLERCEERHIILNKEKQEIGLKEISFHGHVISRDGVKIDDKKVKAINDMQPPTDVSGIKRLCGMVQYMAKFLPDLSTIMEPLRELTRKDKAWHWSKDCEAAFQRIKMMLTETPVLAYFDPGKEVVVQVDSSKDGIGAVLLQDGRPVEYASRSLTVSERNWAQIEKEALSVLYGLERFDQYTYGRNVMIQNDHKPLEAILKKPLAMAPKRLQDIMMRWNRYDFNFVYVKGTNLTIADTLSRAYLKSEEGNFSERLRIMALKSDEPCDIPDARLSEIKEATESDEEMQILKETVMNGWPEQKQETPQRIRHYFDFRDTISYSDGLMLKGEAVIIPKSLRSEMKARLHKAHFGYDSMLRRARGTIFWPGMNSDIKQLADCCSICQERKPMNQNAPLMQHAEGSTPWQKIGLDLFELNGKHYLIAVDYFSSFIEIDLLTSLTSSRVIALLKKQFARFGIPNVIMSDGGPQFVSQEFQDFAKKWGITRMTSSPMHQQANGKAESAVKIMKTLLRKCEAEKTDPYEAILEQRNTPKQDTGISPAEIMFNRKVRGMIPHFPQKLEKPESDAFIRKRNQRRQTVKKSFDKKSREQSELDVGQAVFFQHLEGRNWKLGKINGILGPRTYIVKDQNGTTYRRNRIHLRPTTVNFYSRDRSPMRSVPDDDTEGIQRHFVTDSKPVNNPNSTVSGSAPETPSVELTVPTQNEPLREGRPVRERRKPAYLKDYITG